jgi:hypothetical protein
MQSHGSGCEGGVPLVTGGEDADACSRFARGMGFAAIGVLAVALSVGAEEPQPPTEASMQIARGIDTGESRPDGCGHIRRELGIEECARSAG